jgi:hypothetical protein
MHNFLKTLYDKFVSLVPGDALKAAFTPCADAPLGVQDAIGGIHDLPRSYAAGADASLWMAAQRHLSLNLTIGHVYLNRATGRTNTTHAGNALIVYVNNGIETGGLHFQPILPFKIVQGITRVKVLPPISFA